MPSTRRRFLAVAAGLAASTAGCNDDTARSARKTVTPVDVPRTDEEVLREAAGIDVPTPPTPVVVGDAHHDAAVEQVESIRDAFRERLAAADGPVQVEAVVGSPDTPEAVLDAVEERLEAAREVGPSPGALDTLRRALRIVASAHGYLLAETGDADVDALRKAIEAEEDEADALREGFDYRVAEPGTYLPTLYEGERALARLEDAHHAGVRPGQPEEGPAPGRVGLLNHRLSLARRRRDDVARFRATATDPGVPSRRAALVGALAAVREELAAVAGRYGSGGEERPEGRSTADRLRATRWTVGRRCERYLSEEPADPLDGDRVRVLLDDVDRLVEFRSLDAAVERTLARLDAREFPTGRLLEEKRRAVDGLERAATAPALGRRFVETVPKLLEGADKFHEGEADVDVETFARAHLYYAGAAEWVERGLERGEELARLWQAQQS